MAADEKWYFTKEQLTNTPSRKCGIDADKELSYRQQAANFIQDMGQKLHVTQLCINTAIVYMHRFYVFHSLSQFHRNAIASAALFLAAKVEEQPRKLESVIKISHLCLHRESSSVDIKSEQYLDQAQDLVFNENVLLQTLGFDVAIDHPHTHVVRCCQLVKASKDLAQTSYFMASNSLHLTTMCLQYKPTVVACFCIHLACKWSNWEIPQSNEGKYWFWYVDRTVTAELLQQLTAEFLHIFDKCPSRLKKKIMSISENQSPSMHHQSLPNSLFDAEPRRINSPANDGGPAFQSLRPFPIEEDRRRPLSSAQNRPSADYREHREKKERERLERERMTGASVTNTTATSTSLSLSSSSSAVPVTSAQAPTQDLKSHSHHHKPQSASTLPSSSSSSSLTTATVASTGALISAPTSKHPTLPNQKTNPHHNHHHHRPDVKFPQPSQRHSSNSQSRDPSRDMSRQRIPRDYPTTQAPMAIPPYPHGHQTVHQINSSINDGASTSDITAPNDSLQIHQNTADKIANNNHNAHRPIQHDKRAYDPRHKIMDHRKEEQKNYPAKYTAGDQARIDRQRKPDTLEQRSEEVRKLIEKPLPLPKPRAEVQKEEYIASMLKQSHHPKYGQEKIPTAHNSTRNIMPHDFSKASTSKPLMSNQHSHGVTTLMKDIKNGNSNTATQHSSCNNVDDPKAEKRPRPDEQIPTQIPPVKHKSLFSPEKIPTNREQHSQRSSKSTRQKTPPVSVKTMKQERVQETPALASMLMPQSLQGPNLLSPFTSSQHLPQQQPIVMANFSQSGHKRNKPTNIGDVEQSIKVKIEDQSGFEAMKMLGRVPELIQPIRDTPGSTNGRTNSVANDLKPPELIKPFEPEVDTRHAFTNGLDGINIKNETRDLIQRKDDNNMSIIDRLENPLQIKNEYLCPLKSAQSISALLQEPLAPMPSLLQPIISESSQNPSFDSGIYSSSQTQSQELMNHVQTSMNMAQELAPINDEQFSLSTVDISALSAPIQIVPEVPIVTITNNPLTEVRKTDHHKSEKKKKKEKHKHKDKDKSKEKHKHKHKDKDKEKHRDKDKDKERNKDKDKDRDNKNEENSAAPIKITIPKDKLNLTLDSNIIHDKTSPQGTKLKIKIPKERLKGADSSIVPPNHRDIQAPLKIKIRTSGAIADYPESRKRERDYSDITVAPPNKKSQVTGGVNQLFVGQQQSQQPTAIHQQQTQQHQRSSERQNGRHYNSGSNNKEKHSSREHKSSSKLSQSQQFHAT